MKRTTALLVSLLLAAALLAGCGGSVSERRILFVSTRDGNAEVYLMRADGREATNLSQNAEEDLLPAWSPDGAHIAFTSQRDGNQEIYLVDADGGGLVNLSNDPADDWSPAWSPDGQQIAFASARSGQVDLYVVNADGTGLRQLTDNPQPDTWPAWSPDGSRIAFNSGTQILSIGADGSGQVALTEAAGQAIDLFPTWSPDGRRLAFVSTRDGNWEVYTVDADGANLTNLTRHPADDRSPAWSPDGRRIAFASERDGNLEIYVMPALEPQAQMDGDGGNATRLTDNAADDGVPAWSPDGRQILFVSERDGAVDLFVMPAPGPQARVDDDGDNPVNLTRSPGEDHTAFWSP